MELEVEKVVEMLKKRGLSDEAIAVVVETLKEAKPLSTMSTGISPTCRGAIFKLRRLFYGTAVRDKNVDMKLSQENWKVMASRIVEVIGKSGVQDKPCKILLRYHVERIRDKRVYKPVMAIIEVYTKEKEIPISLKG